MFWLLIAVPDCRQHQFMAAFFELGDLWSAGKCPLSTFFELTVQNIGSSDGHGLSNDPTMAALFWKFRPLGAVGPLGDIEAATAAAHRADADARPAAAAEEAAEAAAAIMPCTVPCTVLASRPALDKAVLAEHLLEHRARCAGGFFQSAEMGIALSPVLAAHLREHELALRSAAPPPTRAGAPPKRRKKKAVAAVEAVEAKQAKAAGGGWAAGRRWNAVRKGGLLLAVVSEMDEDYSGYMTQEMLPELMAVEVAIDRLWLKLLAVEARQAESGGEEVEDGKGLGRQPKGLTYRTYRRLHRRLMRSLAATARDDDSDDEVEDGYKEEVRRATWQKA